MRIILCITYKGDITAKLNRCGSQCPHRLNQDGNTEQLIECTPGKAFAGDVTEFCMELEALILKDAESNGRISDTRWIIFEGAENS